MNYFELFDLPQAPSVDRTLLARKYFELQKANHPDFFTQSTENEQAEALQQSASINKAFNVFQSPEKTLEYFLQTIGLVEHDEKYNLSPDFLMEMMDINESIADEEGESVASRVSELENNLWKEIEPIVNNYNPGTTGDDAILQLKEYYYKKKYIKRILDRLVD